MIAGHNLDLLYKNTGNPLLDFFSKAGSLFSNKNVTSYYGSESGALELFKKAWKEDKKKSMKLLFWLRDRNGGAGNRSGFRDCINWLAATNSDWVESNLSLIPQYGRWSDLKALYKTPIADLASKLWADAILDNKGETQILACKWAKREDKNLQKTLNMNEAELRKLLASKRAEHIIESKMCANEWNKIDYKTIPSVAMSRYTNAFNKHDEKGFAKYKKSLEKAGDDVANLIHAEVLFPYQCLVTAINGDKVIADAQFAALPNYMEKSKYRIMTICDFSSSMGRSGIGASSKLDVCKSLGLYCSDRLGKDNPFYRKFLEFSDNYEVIDWSKQKFSEAVNCGNGNVASTNIEKALMGILSTAKMFKAKQNQMPNVLLLLSDMQFDCGTQNADKTVVEACMNEWKKAGYDIPKIIYWNLAGYAGSPDDINGKNIALVSGFSPSILTAVLGGDDFSPISIMNRTIEKYKITVPKE